MHARTLAIGSTLVISFLVVVPIAKSVVMTGKAQDPIRTFTAPFATFGSVERLDPDLDHLIDPEAKLEKLAQGFGWSESPLWIKKEKVLILSDTETNTIFKWQDGKGISVFMKPAGYDGKRTDFKEPGPNGLAITKKGELLICQHANRRVTQLASLTKPQGIHVPLANQWEGKRLNSPNDIVVHPKTGDIFFTDPPYGLPRRMEDPEKELPFQGVFRIDPKGKLHLLTDAIERPNGIGVSPDGKWLFVANSHEPKPVWLRFPLNADRTLGESEIFFDATEYAKKTKRPGLPDGFVFDKKGNLFASGPGGILIISAKGKHLGTILTGEKTANCEFGEDGSTLYITADSILARIKTKTKGMAF